MSCAVLSHVAISYNIQVTHAEAQEWCPRWLLNDFTWSRNIDKFVLCSCLTWHRGISCERRHRGISCERNQMYAYSWTEYIVSQELDRLHSRSKEGLVGQIRIHHYITCTTAVVRTNGFASDKKQKSTTQFWDTWASSHQTGYNLWS